MKRFLPLLLLIFLPNFSYASRIGRELPRGIWKFLKLQSQALFIPHFNVDLSETLSEPQTVILVTHILEAAVSTLANQEEAFGPEFEPARYAISSALKDAEASVTVPLYESPNLNTETSWQLQYVVDFDTDQFVYLTYNF